MEIQQLCKEILSLKPSPGRPSSIRLDEDTIGLEVEIPKEDDEYKIEYLVPTPKIQPMVGEDPIFEILESHIDSQ